MTGLTAPIDEDPQTRASYTPQTVLPSPDDIGHRPEWNPDREETCGTETEKPASTENGLHERPVEQPVIPPKTTMEPRGRFRVLQSYEGVVLSVGNDSFWARLVDRSTSGTEDEEAEFPIEEVSEPDRRLVRPGAIFYWYIGYNDSMSGQRTRQSVLRFRRLPAYTAEELTKARAAAKTLLDELGGAGE